MSAIDIIAFAVGLAGLVFGVNSYLELWKWAKQCQRARVVIAYNHRVRMQAPLTDWLAWANTLGGNQKETGRVVFTDRKFSVAVVNPNRPAPVRETFRAIRNLSKRRGNRTDAPTVPTETTSGKRVAA